MSGFRAAQIEQAALKMALSGPTGSGKTFTTLLFAEGLAQREGKKIAYVDSERGTDFYTKAVAERLVHPEAFVFDALYTRSLTEVLTEVKQLSWSEYGVVVLDSITHLWEAALAAYRGKPTATGGIPIWAWKTVKKPYKDLLNYLMNAPCHFFILGREGQEFGKDEDTGEMAAKGPKMRAEAETAYEPHIWLRLESVRKDHKRGKPLVAVPTAFALKDRSGLLQGQVIEWPNYQNVIAPLVALLGGRQGTLPNEEEAAFQDSESLRKQEIERVAASRIVRTQLVAKFMVAADLTAIEGVAKEITKEVKMGLMPGDLAEVKQAYLDAKAKVMLLPERAAPPREEDS